jgi:ABC-type Mn2+/Zn2+ transport system ATPase subunit
MTSALQSFLTCRLNHMPNLFSLDEEQTTMDRREEERILTLVLESVERRGTKGIGVEKFPL